MVEPGFKEYFPGIVSYNRFVELKPRINLYLFAFINLCLSGLSTGVSYIDSTKLVVCHNLRIHSNKVFKGIAKRGKTSTGWFFGMKLHLIINHAGEIVSFWLTPGNVADNNRDVVIRMCANLFGKLFGDKGYISKDLFRELFGQGVELFTTIRKNMKNKLINFLLFLLPTMQKKQKITTDKGFGPILVPSGLLKTFYMNLKHIVTRSPTWPKPALSVDVIPHG
jgi:hypothetical protein